MLFGKRMLISATVKVQVARAVSAKGMAAAFWRAELRVFRRRVLARVLNEAAMSVAAVGAVSEFAWRRAVT